MKDTSWMLDASVPAAVDGIAGIYDTEQDATILDFGQCSSIFLEEITGADEIDIELYYSSKLHASLPRCKPHATYGSGTHLAQQSNFNRVVLKNSTDVVVKVALRINYYGQFFYSTNSGGGGGIATHVKIDGTPKVEVTKAPPVTIDIPKDLEVVIKDGTKVGLSDGTTVEVSKMPKVDVAFPATLPVTGTVGLSAGTTVEVTKAPPVTINIPKDLEVIIKDGTKVGLSDGTTVEVSKMPKVDVTFPTSMNTEITNTPSVKVAGGVKIDGAVDIAGIVGVSGFSENSLIGIRGTVQTTIDTSKKPLDVAFDGSAIKVVPAPPPRLCAGGMPTVNKAIKKLVSERPKRVSLSIQAHYANSGDIYLRDADNNHEVCAIIPQGSSWSDAYSGELWASADNDGLRVQIMELYND